MHMHPHLAKCAAHLEHLIVIASIRTSTVQVLATTPVGRLLCNTPTAGFWPSDRLAGAIAGTRNTGARVAQNGTLVR